MRIFIAFAAALTVVAGGLFAYAHRHPELAPAPALPRANFAPDLVAKGEKLAGLGACVTCHTRPGGAPYAGGLKLPTPFGAIYATNITPHVDTGIGAWSENAFKRAMREGIDRRGRHLYPAFPYDHFAKTTDEDLRAIYAYLMTRKPVEQAPTPNELRFPFNIRPLLAGWNLLFHDPSPFRPDPTRSAAWNEGAYYVQALGHCGACHSPRNAFGAVKTDAHLAGGEAEGWHSPGLGAHAAAPVPWTKDSLLNYLIDGWDGRHGVAAGPMTAVVDHLAGQPESVVEAIVEYLLSLQPPADPKKTDDIVRAARAREYAAGATPVGDGPMARGEAVFARACANCHRQGGSATPLALGAAMNAPHAGNLLHVVLEGIKPPKGSPEKSMPRFALPDDQLADLATYMRTRFTDKPAWESLPEQIRAARSAK